MNPDIKLRPPKPVLPDRINNLADVLDLYCWLDQNRTQREKVDHRQNRRLTLLVAEAHDCLHAIDSHIHLCYVGAALRSGMSIDAL